MRKTGTLAWRIAVAVGPILGALYIRLVRRTVRWEWVGRDILDDVLANRRTVIAAFWHGRILMMAPVAEESVRPMHVVISANRDGELIARLIRRFGVRTLRGSTRNPQRRRGKGGNAVLRASLDRLKAGDLIAITPDGPRGPPMQAQGGVAAMSAWTDTPVVPFAWATRRARVLRSWDGFLMPWPFDRGVYVVGAPIVPNGDGEGAVEAHRLAIERGLDAVTRLADERVGRVPVDPA